MSHVPCKFYKQGTCTAGANCTFSHSSDLSSESAVCKYFVKGNCKFGTKCALLHTMSPYNNNGKSRTSPPQPLLLPGSRRKTNEHMSNSLDHRSFLHDPFASSAPAVSLFHTSTGEQLWRNPQQQQQTSRTINTAASSMISNDFIGVRSSPRESSDHLLGGSYRQQSSVRSNSGYFNSIPVENNSMSSSYRRQQQQLPQQQMQQQQQQNYGSIDDLNDAMLPSSLNDLFTPTELHARSLRQQETIFDNSQTWRMPFFKQDDEGSAAINIPGGNNSGSSGGSSGSYLQGNQNNNEDFLHDDDVQFFMEDDEAVTYDHMNNTAHVKSNQNYTFPSLISLPST